MRPTRLCFALLFFASTVALAQAPRPAPGAGGREYHGKINRGRLSLKE